MVKAVPEQPQQKKKAQKRSSMPRGYIVRHLDEAIEKKWIKVYYQPIVRTISRELCAMEALARWDDPTYGFLTPPQFIGVLEQHNLIDKLDRYMIEAVCRNFARLRKAGRQAVPISLNLSRLDFITCDIFAVVEETLRRFDVPRDMLHLEVVESILTDRVKVIGTSLDKFRNAGYEIWMDDFGSGYSTLNFLKDQRFDVLKMDMAFLKSDTQRARDIILSIIAMDKRIGNRTLAEGVETEEQFHFLRESGCEKVQGYYLGRPMPYDKSVEECLTQGIGIEERNWKSYYDAIARVDFLAEQPLMLLEYREGSYQLLFANERCAKMLWDSAPGGAARWPRRSIARTIPICIICRMVCFVSRRPASRRTFLMPGTIPSSAWKSAWLSSGNNVHCLKCVAAASSSSGKKNRCGRSLSRRQSFIVMMPS